MSFINWISSYLVFFHEEPVHMHMANWMSVGDMNVNYGMLLDSLSMVVMVPMGVVTLLVLFYSLDYMRHDPNNNRFYMMLSVFAMFMTMLVMSDNYIMMFIGWEFVGVISYLLMSFWNTRMAAMKSALSAVLLNRVGDTFFVIGLAIMLNMYHTVDFQTLELLLPYANTTMMTLMGMMLLVASTAKSAQLGLHGWLLSAMEAPTPVSSLLHAATMVCSGVFVLVRSANMLEYSPTMLLTMLWLGGITTLMSGLMAVVSNDMKRVIALSTMSQLAMMMMAMGTSAYDLAMYHLYCHAFFKALLFMSAGSIMHSFMSETQDMRKYGGLLNYLPFTYTCMLMASLSLMAMPGLTGYYSKDMMIESLYGSYTLSGYMLYYIATASATTTAIYSLRVMYLTFYNNPRSNKYTYSFMHESNHMAMPMSMLAMYSMFLGYARDNVTFHLVFGSPSTNSFMETEYTLPAMFKLLPLMLGLSLSLTLVYIYEFTYKLFANINTQTQYKSTGKYNPVYNYLNQRMFYEHILNNIIIRPVTKFGGLLNVYTDNGLLKVTGSTGIGRLLNNLPLLIIINILFMLMM
uniref:NADH-ubiquinone oxidoreductase chain 5 n=1 Tax=Millerozyma farinosa TaxID=4920 RepID=E3PQT0_MILFA|nr:NADH dehydrogenase subunit 5 [Millerozyma farinosa]